MNFNTSSNICNPLHNKSLNDCRPSVLSPKSSSQVLQQGSEILTASCEKRNFREAFNNENEEERYGQKVTDKFFETNIGHCVISVNEEDNKKIVNNTDTVIQGINVGSDDKFQYKKPKETNDIQEIIDWCEFYRNNRNLFNV